MKTKRNDFARILIILFVVVLGVFGYFGYVNPDTKSSINTSASWKTYKADANYGNISFEYANTFPVAQAGKFIENNTQGISLVKFDINNFDRTAWAPSITKESVQKYYDSLQRGIISGKSSFSLWSVDSSDKIKKTKSGKFFRVSSTFTIAEVCDLQFTTRIEIPVSENIILINIVGNTDRIRKSMINSPLLSDWGGCNAKSFAENGQKDFYNLLVSGGGTPEARDWYDTAVHVMDSLNY